MYIELKNINKSFGSFKASDNVSFGLEKGKLIGQSVMIEDFGRLKGFEGSGKALIRPEFIEINKFQDNG